MIPVSFQRHESGLSLRFPRVKALRRDKNLKNIDTLQTARNLLYPISSSQRDSGSIATTAIASVTSIQAAAIRTGRTLLRSPKILLRPLHVILDPGALLIGKPHLFGEFRATDAAQ